MKITKLEIVKIKPRWLFLKTEATQIGKGDGE